MKTDNNKDLDLARFNELFTAQEEMLPIWLKSERLYNSQHLKSDSQKRKDKRRSDLFIPITRNTVNIIKAIFTTAFFSNGNPIELVPIGDDENELWTDRNKILKYYYNKLKPNKELSKAFLSALLYRIGIVITYWDDQKKKVITTNIPVTDIAFDNECVNIDDVQEIAYKYYESNRIIKQKIQNGFYNQKKLMKKLFSEDDGTNNNNKRRKIKVLYTQTAKGYKVKTFIGSTLVRVSNVKNSPFQYGYALENIPAIDEDKRKDEILCYGMDVPTVLSEIQEEINRKRNIKNDIQEKILNPDVYVGDNAKVKPQDLNYGSGKRIRVEGDISQIQERQVPSEYALNADLSMLAGDVQSAVGVNSIQEGQTSASDRRSAVALATVNSNSSMRIEEMIMLIKETLFEHWAKTWTNIVFKNADDSVINAVTGKEYPLGRKGKRDSIEYDLRINFGMTLDKEKRIQDLLGIYQITAQNPNINPKIIEKMLKKILDLRIGEDTDLDELFVEVQQEEQNQPTPEQLEEQKQKEALLNGGLA